MTIASRREVRCHGGVVSAGHPAAARAGAELLQRGGNAVDALVGGAFTAFVVEPWNCGLGGYGHASAFLPDAGFLTVDHHLRAPMAAHAEMYRVDPELPRLSYGWPAVEGRRNEWDALSVGVPGAVAGLCMLHERAGRLPLEAVLAPAIAQARGGLVVTWDLLLAVCHRLPELRQLPELAGWLLTDGMPPRVGQRLDCTDLAGTLERIARAGSAGLHEGRVAEAVDAAVAARGGILTAADLAAYQPKVLEERPGTFAGHAYVTANDQLGYETLNLIEALGVLGHEPADPAFHHLTAEALAHAFADNLTHCADPDAWPSPLVGLASPAFARERARAVDPERAAPRPVAAGDPWPFEPGVAGPRAAAPSAGGVRGTSQVVAADADGGMAAVITTLSNAFGSLLLVPGTGVVLNNGMQNFDANPGLANSIAPGRMPLFAAPLVVAARDGRGTFACAGSGGYRIATGVLSTTVHALGRDLGLQAAVDEPRVHCQGGETSVDARLPDEIPRRLAEMGHDVVVQEEAPGTYYFGRVCAVAAVAAGTQVGASGPAWNTAVAGLEHDARTEDG